MEYGDYRVVAEVNLDHIAYNVQQIRKLLKKQTKIMAVVKADAYGHGVKETAKVLLREGVERLAVAILDEAIQLRLEGLTVPILVLGFTPKDQIRYIVKYDVMQTVFTYDMAKQISEEAVTQNKTAVIHIKIDTGMGRIGFPPNENTVEILKKIIELPNIKIEGIFTHFATADEEDQSYTIQQYNLFTNFITDIEEQGIKIPLKHAANSAAIIADAQYHLDMVRPGIILYGLYPSHYLKGKGISLKPAMSIKSYISLVKEVDSGQCISYGRKYITSKKSKIATVPVGYADGYSRLLSNRGEVLIHGQRAKVRGTVCMDQFMVDVTHIDHVTIGDEVVLFGEQQEALLSTEEVADLIGTINYELICMIGKRIPRQYILNGQAYQVLNFLIDENKK